MELLIKEGITSIVTRIEAIVYGKIERKRPDKPLESFLQLPLDDHDVDAIREILRSVRYLDQLLYHPS